MCMRFVFFIREKRFKLTCRMGKRTFAHLSIYTVRVNHFYRLLFVFVCWRVPYIPPPSPFIRARSLSSHRRFCMPAIHEPSEIH